jgi:hypothetical protein
MARHNGKTWQVGKSAREMQDTHPMPADRIPGKLNNAFDGHGRAFPAFSPVRCMMGITPFPWQESGT